MIACSYKIINKTETEIKILHYCYKINLWLDATWSGGDTNQEIKCCPLCGNHNIIEEA